MVPSPWFYRVGPWASSTRLMNSAREYFITLSCFARFVSVGASLAGRDKKDVASRRGSWLSNPDVHYARKEADAREDGVMTLLTQFKTSQAIDSSILDATWLTPTQMSRKVPQSERDQHSYLFSSACFRNSNCMEAPWKAHRRPH